MKALAASWVVAVLAVVPLCLSIVALLVLQAVPADLNRFIVARRWLYAVIVVLGVVLGIVILARFAYFRK